MDGKKGVETVVQADRMRYPSKRGYAKRYVRHEIRKNRLSLALGFVFLLGAAAGCWMAGGQSGQVLQQLQELLSGEQGSFLEVLTASFTANALLLLILCLCGLGAVFQPIALGVLFWKGLGVGVLGVYAYSSGERSAVVQYLLILLPQALLELLLLLKGAAESLHFSTRFFAQLLPEKAAQAMPVPQGNIGGYLAKFLILYLLGGTVSLLAGVLRLVFTALVG